MKRRTYRVWILNHYADAPDRPTGTRHYSLARGMVDRGADVTIFAAGHDHAIGVRPRLSPGHSSRVRAFDGVRFTWLWTIPYRGNTWRRMANMASYAVMVSVAEIGRPRPDAVIGSTVHPFAALAGWWIARRRHARFFYEIRDLWPQTLIDLGAMREGSLGARLLGWIERFLVEQADGVITLLPGVQAYLDLKGMRSDHVVYVPNGADFALTDAPYVPPAGAIGAQVTGLIDEIDALRRRGITVFGYVGAHGRVNALDVVLRAAAATRDLGGPPSVFYLVGDGPEKAALKELARAMSLESVVFAESVPKTVVPELLRHLDVGIIHTTYTPVYRYGISFNKLFDYMAASLPVLFACSTAYDPIVASGAGLTIAPDDPQAMANAMVELAAMSPEERASMGAAGRTFVELNHDMIALSNNLADLLGVP